jgi:hypothetical protein
MVRLLAVPAPQPWIKVSSFKNNYLDIIFSSTGLLLFWIGIQTLLKHCFESEAIQIAESSEQLFWIWSHSDCRLFWNIVLNPEPCRLQTRLKHCFEFGANRIADSSEQLFWIPIYMQIVDSPEQLFWIPIHTTVPVFKVGFCYPESKEGFQQAPLKQTEC